MKKLLLFALLLGWTWNVFADLNATVYPGYTFGANERPTTAKLNALGTPTIVISGTIGGTNSGLAADSITGTMLDSSTYDGVTITKTNGALRVHTNAITTLQLYTNMFSSTSALNPSTGAVVWNPDWNFLAISNNQATVRTQVLAGALDNLMTNLLPAQISLADGYIIQGGVGATGVAVTVSSVLTASGFYYSNSAAVPLAGGAVNLTHGLGVVPSFLRVYLKAQSSFDDPGWETGDSINIESVTSSGQERPAFVISASTTQIQIRRHNLGQYIRLLSKSNGSVTESRNEPPTDYLLVVIARR